MLIASNFILNRSTHANQYILYPYIHQTSNVLKASDQTRQVGIPDVIPRELIPEGSDFSMCAGDFLETYKNQQGEWDCICTCFFLDTARNIIEYVELIESLLKPGGVWINLGPLLYHFADTPGELSIELSYEELKGIIETHGFTIEKQAMKNCVYTSNRLSMMQVVYSCVFFTAIKK